MKNRKPRVFFLSDIDGHNAAVVALSSRRQVLELVPNVQERSIHVGLTIGGGAERLALATPGQLYVRPMLMPSSAWRASHGRHPSYVTAKV